MRPERGEVSRGLLGALGALCTMKRRERMDRVHREPHPRSMNRSVTLTVSHVHRNPIPFESIYVTWQCLSSPRGEPSPAQTGPYPALAWPTARSRPAQG
jgi:hypothetical protein